MMEQDGKQKPMRMHSVDMVNEAMRARMAKRKKSTKMGKRKRDKMDEAAEKHKE